MWIFTVAAPRFHEPLIYSSVSARNHLSLKERLFSKKYSSEKTDLEKIAYFWKLFIVPFNEKKIVFA